MESARVLRLPLHGVILTSQPAELDVITYDDSEPVRAKMSCGHVIGPESLYQYCSRELNKGATTLSCPSCSAEWDYSTVRHVACLTNTERQQFEKQLSENQLHKQSEIQCCGGCGSWCSRINTQQTRVTCSMCSQRLGRTYDFCWDCLVEWRDTLDGTCGNPGCPGGKQRVLQQLATCPLTDIAGTQCPSVRACPHCSTLLQHIQYCQHIKCKSCSYYFCFICLKKKNPANDGRHSPTTCASPWSCRTPAERQTQLSQH